MSKEREPSGTTSMLEYRHKDSKIPIQRRPFFWFVVAALSIVAGGAALAGIGVAPEIVVGVCGFLLMVLLFGSVYLPAFLQMRKKSVRYGDSEKEERESNRRRKEMILVAERVYQRAPIGKWRYVTGRVGTRGMPIIYEERVLVFKEEGRGEFRWFRRETDVVIETAFQYKVGDEDRTLLVQLISPQRDGWHEVRYNFSVVGRIDDDPHLVLTIYGNNPIEGLGGLMADFWPFHGDFSREA